VRSIERKLAGKPVPVTIPMGADSTFSGIIDLLEMKAYFYDPASMGTKVREAEIPDKFADQVKHWRHHLDEKVSETDDGLMAKYLEEQPLPASEVRKALRKATIEGRLHPLFAGSSLKYVGVQKVLDGVIEYLPSPLDRPPVKGHASLKDEKIIERKPSPDEPFSALVFKIVADKPLDLYFLRIYSGKLRSGSRVFNTNTGDKENISRMFRMFAKRRDQLDEAVAGDIVACVGLKDALTGHTLCDAKHPILLERIEFPVPVISVSIEPTNTKDRDALGEALRRLERQDPTFKHYHDAETGQTLISGMGELHLEVLGHKLERDFKIPIAMGRPRVAYREAITRAAEAEGSFVRQTGGRGQYAVVNVRLEPINPAKGEPHFEFFDATRGGAIDQAYVPAVERGLKEAMSQGVLAGFEVLNIRATLLDGKEHPVDSSEIAFENAGRIAFGEAMKAAGPVILEPIMKLFVSTPDDYFGAVTGDLSARRGLIQDTEAREGQRVIEAHVPLSEMFQYATKLRTLTQGRAAWSMEPLRYERMPENLQRELLKLHGYE